MLIETGRGAGLVVTGSPPPPLWLDATNLYAVISWGEITGALPLYPRAISGRAEIALERRALHYCISGHRRV